MKNALSHAGTTLFELLVAVLVLALASAMIYSVLNTSIKFSEKGEKKLQVIAREHGLLELMHRQIKCAWFDNKQKKIMISADPEILRIVTRQPLLYRSAGMVLAVYRFKEDEQAVYYTEKKDFYNVDYNDQYFPDFEDMEVLIRENINLSFAFDKDSNGVTVEMDNKSFEFFPRSADVVLNVNLGG